MLGKGKAGETTTEAGRKEDGDTNRGNGTMEEAEVSTIRDWMDTTTRGYHPWMSLIISNKNKIIIEWPPEMEEEKDCVKWALRNPGKDFWYARIGEDALVAALDGSRAHANMKRIKKDLIPF